MQNYVNIVFAQGCTSLIIYATSVISTSSTLIDHVYTNDGKKYNMLYTQIRLYAHFM